MLKRLRQAVISFLAGLLLFGIAPQAFAVAYSGWINLGTTNGVTYKGQAYTDTSGTPYVGGQLMGTNKDIPAGWGGTLGWLYRNDTLCVAGGAKYNSANVTVFANGVSGNCGSGRYNGIARLDRWNGSTYEQTAQNSPYQNK